MNYLEWLLSRKKLYISTAKHYAGAVFGTLSRNPSFTLGGKSVSEITDLKMFRELKRKIFASSEFKEMNDVGHRMYSAALNSYEVYLKEVQEADFLIQEIKEIQDNTGIPVTEREVLVKARLGQGKYREGLLQLWSGKCSVTGFSDERFLIASHIKPWALADHKEKLDPFNGLLLIPNLDKAFDLGIISFDPEENGRIIFSDCMKNPERLGISDQMKVQTLRDETIAYLEFHKENVFLHSY